jgi:hemerythrin superfamily protein
MYIRDDKITILMAKNHANLDLMINKVVDGVNMTNKTRIAQFKKFKEKLLSHMLVEEGSVFGFTTFNDTKIMNTIRKLLKEHSDMKYMVEQIEQELLEGKSNRLGDFMQLMYNHQLTENSTFYPYLDKELPPEQRDQVLNNIKDLL